MKRIEQFRSIESNKEKILGINIGKNKLQEDAVKDYLEGIRAFGNQASYIVINISSPNTPGLRSLQNKKLLDNLIDPVKLQTLKKNLCLFFLLLSFWN